MNSYKLLIGGKLVPGAKTLPVINPATKEVLAVAPRADRAQLDQAVAAAKAAFPAWAAKPIRQRAAAIVKIADAIEGKQAEFARLLTEEQGKTLAESEYEMAGVIERLRYFATLDLPPKLLKEDATQKIVEERAPLGAVAAITAWNVPMILLAMKVGPALLAGDTVVLKPAPSTPLTALKFGELVAKIVPPGVINIITDQNDLGGALTSHPDIAKGTRMGPLQNKAQFEKVKSLLEDARKNGKIVAGGKPLDRKGYFIPPTIVRDIDDDARLVREEQFGPVLPVLSCSDVEDAIARANDTDYGLGGSVWPKDSERAFAVAEKIGSETVWVNKHLDMQADILFRGAKQSGIGTEQGLEGLEEFTQAKVINMAKSAA